MADSGQILVTGATGNVGRHVVSLLRKRGVAVRALTRFPQAADLPEEVEVVAADLTDPESLRPALEGVNAVFLLWPMLTAEGAAPVVDVIARHARRMVYLSAMSVRDDREPQANGVWGMVEYLIERSGVDWTFLRAGGFATNTLGWADQVRAGVVHWPYGAAARSLIHERDIAAVAALALTEDRHIGAKYVLTGPTAITQADQVRIIGEAIGRPVRWVETAPEVARQQMLATLGDSGFVEGALAYWASLVEEPEPVTNTVEAVTGVPARTFREWAEDHVIDFRPLSTADIAQRYVSAFRHGRITDALRLAAPDMVRTAPMETAGEPVELRGLEEILEHSRQLNADVKITGVEVDGPFLYRDQFAVRFAIDEIHMPTGRRGTTTKMCRYTVADQKITSEEVFYLTRPAPFG
jgi:uncharacterized protein YbjT (DUF2867 family)